MMTNSSEGRNASWGRGTVNERGITEAALSKGSGLSVNEPLNSRGR